MIDLTDRVAVVTGAGAGLGRSHALLLARRGARVVVNDVSDDADAVVDEIRAAGGEAVSAIGSVADPRSAASIVARATEAWGRIDILVNNAGILRDRSFAKMDMDDFRLVLDVHLMGAVYCTKAAWEPMRAQRYGRIVFTTSSSGLWGNFGQSNYGAAKMALVGFMQTLSLEGAAYDIKVNCLAPTAATQMLRDLMPEETHEVLDPSRVSPGLLALVDAASPTRTILCAGAGGFETAQICYSRGIYLDGQALSAEAIQDDWRSIHSLEGATVPGSASEQTHHELGKAGVVLPRSDRA